MNSSLAAEVKQAASTDVYKFYLRARDLVVVMLEEWTSSSDAASSYWIEELAGFDYMLDASPLVIRSLREHCHHITGLRSYDYRGHHSHLKKKFEDKFRSAFGGKIPKAGIFLRITLIEWRNDNLSGSSSASSAASCITPRTEK